MCTLYCTVYDTVQCIVFSVLYSVLSEQLSADILQYCTHCTVQYFRLRSYKHEYEFGTVRVPVYEFWQTRYCVYFNGGRSRTYEYGLPVNFTRTSSFCAGRVFIQPVQSKLPVNSTNIIYHSCGAYLTSELTSL